MKTGVPFFVLHVGDATVTGNNADRGVYPITDCPLTAREISVITCISQGLGIIGTGELLGLSPLTVKSHMARIRDELNMKRTRGPSLVAHCIREGWI